MNRTFYLRSGEEVDPIKYSLDIQAKYPKKYEDLKIFVGTDSQNRKRGTCYVGIIAFRFPGGRGAHFIYCLENVKKIKDIGEKLRGEVTLSMEIATALHMAGVKIHCIDFDFNSNDLYRSQEVVAYARGWALGMGFNCTVKPDENQIASRAADNIVKGKQKRRRAHVRARKKNGPVAQ